MSYVLIFLLSEKDITDYTVVDTEYWRESKNRLLTKTAYEYNSKEELQKFPKILGDYRGFDYKYSENVYKVLNADIILSRTYVTNKSFIWVDFINSKTGESFHKQKICIEGAGWKVDNESIAEFKIAELPNPFTKLYANRLDISKGKEKQTVIYWFMFKKFGAKDAVTMIRIASPFYNATDFNSVKDFIENQLFDAMYEKSGAESIITAEYLSKQYGNKGLFAMIMMLLIPVGITVIGIIKKD